eukprot:PhF_6_TR38715/c0_g1_i2/m.57943
MDCLIHVIRLAKLCSVALAVDTLNVDDTKRTSHSFPAIKRLYEESCKAIQSEVPHCCELAVFVFCSFLRTVSQPLRHSGLLKSCLVVIAKNLNNSNNMTPNNNNTFGFHSSHTLANIVESFAEMKIADVELMSRLVSVSSKFPFRSEDRVRVHAALTQLGAKNVRLR